MGRDPRPSKDSHPRTPRDVRRCCRDRQLLRLEGAPRWHLRRLHADGDRAMRRHPNGALGSQRLLSRGLRLRLHNLLQACPDGQLLALAHATHNRTKQPIEPTRLDVPKPAHLRALALRLEEQASIESMLELDMWVVLPSRRGLSNSVNSIVISAAWPTPVITE
jgi:hypothetical protein